MSKYIRNYADNGDFKELKHVFTDALDIDPTFEQYQEDYEYCQNKGLLESHRELTPFISDPSRWTEDYWIKLKMDLVENFSEQRMEHMRKVAKVYLAEKIVRLERERASTRSSHSEPKRIAQAKGPTLSPSESKRTTQAKGPTQGRKEQDAQIAERQRKLEEETRAANKAERDQKERVRAAQEQYRKQSTQHTGKSGGSASKKVLGIVVVLAVIIVLLLLVLKPHNPQSLRLLLRR